MRIAQRFNAGIGGASEIRSPVGTTERPSTVPTGLVDRLANAFPALKGWATVNRPYGTDRQGDVGKGLSPREAFVREGSAPVEGVSGVLESA